MRTKETPLEPSQGRFCIVRDLISKTRHIWDSLRSDVPGTVYLQIAWRPLSDLALQNIHYGMLSR